MNLTSAVEFQPSDGSLLGLAAVYSAMFVASLAANSKVLSALRKTRYRNSVVNQLIAWQCMAGLAVGLISLPLVFARLVLKSLLPPTVSVLCMVIDVYSTVLIALIYHNFVAVGIFRYMHVFHPMKMVNGADRRLLKILVSITIAGLVLTSVGRYFTPVQPLSFLLCTVQTDKLYREPWITGVIPLHIFALSVLALYCRIYVYLLQQRKRVAQNRSQPDVEGVGAAGQKFGLQRHLKKVNLVSARASALTSLLCECCNFSINTLNILDIESVASHALFLHYLTASLTFSMSFVPAVLYCWSNEELRLQLLRLFTRRCQKKEVSFMENPLRLGGPVVTVSSKI